MSISILGNGAFNNNLKEIIIPDDIDIEDSAFVNCTNLVKIKISDSHKYLMQDSGVIYNKSGTKLICCPSSLKLEEYNVLDGTIEICDYAFQFNDSLKQIVLPEGVKKIGYKSFYFCGYLQKINIPNTVESIGKFSFTCCGLTELILSNRLKTIPENAFISCTFLKRITIPEGVKSIKYKAFANLFSLVSVSIPDSVTTIDDYAFNKCNTAMIIQCNKGSVAEEYANKKGIKCDYDLQNLTDDNELVTYKTMGITYSLQKRWQHIPVDDQNDMFTLDVYNMTDNVIMVKVQDLSEYALMMDTDENKELFVSSIVTGTMKSLKMDKDVSDFPMKDYRKDAILKMGRCEYGVATIYFELFGYKLFSLSLITKDKPDEYIEDLIDCVFSTKDTDNEDHHSVSKNLENNGILVQQEQDNVVYSVWNDWSCTENINQEYGMTGYTYFKANGYPSDGTLYVLTIRNVFDEAEYNIENYQTLLDLCIVTFNLTNVDIDKQLYLTDNQLLGYKATTGNNSPINYDIFVSYKRNIAFCFIMMSSNEKATNTAWLDTVINTIKVDQ